MSRFLAMQLCAFLTAAPVLAAPKQPLPLQRVSNPYACRVDCNSCDFATFHQCRYGACMAGRPWQAAAHCAAIASQETERARQHCRAQGKCK